MTRMGAVQRLAEEMGRGRRVALPKLRKTVVRKLALAVGAMIEVRTPNTAALANVLPLATERQDRRGQWLRRLLKNPLLASPTLLEPWARHVLAEASRNEQTVVLSLDQTELGDRFAVLMLGVVIGDRALPLAWAVEAGPANRGFTHQETVLERVRGWLPDGAEVLLLADRFYPCTDLFQWLHRQGWQYRLRVKGNLSVEPGFGNIVTTGELARGFMERYLPDVRLWASEIPTNLGIVPEAGHPEPGIIAMDGSPTKAAERDYSSRWGIEPLFSDFKRRGFDLATPQLRAPARLDRLLLIMALARHWCVRAGQEDARHHPTPLEKKLKNQPIRTIGPLENSPPAPCPGSSAVCGCS